MGGYLLYRGHVERREYEARSERVRFGFDAEIEMAIDLQERGANVELSPGSRGAIDARVSWSRARWGVQHKASLDGEPRWPGPDERARLIKESRAIGVRPVVGLRAGDEPTTYYDARTRAPLAPPSPANSAP
jgi:hypothetical protein